MQFRQSSWIPGTDETGHGLSHKCRMPHLQEQAKFDADPSKHVRLWEGVNAKTGARFRCAACWRCSWRGRTRCCSGASDLKALNSNLQMR